MGVVEQHEKSGDKQAVHGAGLAPDDDTGQHDRCHDTGPDDRGRQSGEKCVCPKQCHDDDGAQPTQVQPRQRSQQGCRQCPHDTQMQTAYGQHVRQSGYGECLPLFLVDFAGISQQQGFQYAAGSGGEASAVDACQSVVSELHGPLRQSRAFVPVNTSPPSLGQILGVKVSPVAHQGGIVKRFGVLLVGDGRNAGAEKQEISCLRVSVEAVAFDTQQHGNVGGRELTVGLDPGDDGASATDAPAAVGVGLVDACHGVGAVVK